MNSPHSRIKKLIIYTVCIIGLLYIYTGIRLFHKDSEQQKAAQTEITISFSEKRDDVRPLNSTPQKLSFEEYCRRNPISTCWDQQKPEDFLYQEDIDTPVAIMPQEEFSPELLEDATNIEATYEEDLPEDIIEASDVYTSKAYSLHIIPERKPPHFPTPSLAIVIDDMGISLKRTADISSLRAPLTSSFLTYGHKLAEQIQVARNSGHEIMVHVPMEAKSNIDVAPDVLTTSMTPTEIQQKLISMLDKFEQIKGINNHMGSKLTEDKQRMDAVMEILYNRGLFFLDSKTSANSHAEESASAHNVAYAHRHVFIDNNNDKAYILSQLKKAENIALRNGYAIAIGHPKSQTYAALKEWLPSLPEKGIELIPLSKIIYTLHPNFQKKQTAAKKN